MSISKKRLENHEAKSRKPLKAPVLLSLPDRVHDRLSTDLVRNALVSIAIVDDPYSTIGEKIKVLRSHRDDPLAGMLSRGQIDKAQYEAGREWQRHMDHAEIGGIRAIDPAKEAVDGGLPPEPINDEQIKSFKALNRAATALGSEGCGLVKDILGRRLTVLKAATERGCTSEQEIKYIGKRFRECLETLAILWGFAMHGDKRA